MTYYADPEVTVHLGDYRDVLPGLATVDAVITDPPYGTTNLPWDRWVPGWPEHMTTVTDCLWSFLPLRAVLERSAEFAAWRYAQDVVWEKANGAGFTRDRFRRVHEHAVQWYRGRWSEQHHDTPLVASGEPLKNVRRGISSGPHVGALNVADYVDTGQRLMRSVMRAPAVRFGAHPTEKPQNILRALVAYSVPPGGVVLDPFAGSLSLARAAVATGRRAVVIEGNERYAEAGVQALLRDRAAVTA